MPMADDRLPVVVNAGGEETGSKEPSGAFVLVSDTRRHCRNPVSRASGFVIAYAGAGND